MHADAEARAVAANWPGVVARTGVGSTCERLENALGDSTLVHVAAHGRHLTQNPLFSSLELADGPLFAYDLDAGVEVAEVVVLSACELGMSTVRPGDQSLGWTAVLLDKGARSVVSAVASVNDRVTGQVMTDLHVRLRAGVDSASALAQAQAAAHARGDVAPFACFGAGVTARG
jgi:CHAT domain-containing protein